LSINITIWFFFLFLLRFFFFSFSFFFFFLLSTTFSFGKAIVSSLALLPSAPPRLPYPFPSSSPFRSPTFPFYLSLPPSPPPLWLVCCYCHTVIVTTPLLVLHCCHRCRHSPIAPPLTPLFLLLILILLFFSLLIFLPFLHISN